MKPADFKRLGKKDDKIVEKLSGAAHVKTYWKHHKDIEKDFHNTLSETESYEHWVYTNAGKPLYYVIMKPLSKEDAGELSPWVEGSCYWLDLISLSKHYDDTERFSQALKAFTESFNGKRSFLADPDVKEDTKIQVLENAGLKRIGSLIRGEGFFKGSSHHVMRS